VCWSSDLAYSVNTGDCGSVITLFCNSLGIHYSTYCNHFKNEFTFQKSFVSKMTVTKNRNSAKAECFMGLRDEVNGL